MIRRPQSSHGLLFVFLWKVSVCYAALRRVVKVQISKKKETGNCAGELRSTPRVSQPVSYNNEESCGSAPDGDFFLLSLYIVCSSWRMVGRIAQAKASSPLAQQYFSRPGYCPAFAVVYTIIAYECQAECRRPL